MPFPDPVELIAKSGHKLTFEVISILKALEWDVDISPRYLDENSGTIREMDIIAEKNFAVRHGEGGIALRVRLVVETKFIVDPWVLITVNDDELEDDPWNRFKFYFKPEDTSYIPVINAFASQPEHRYFRASPVIFSCNTGRDEFFNSTSAVIQSIQFQNNHHIGTRLGTGLVVYFPIVVVDSEEEHPLLTVPSDKINSGEDAIRASLSAEPQVVAKVNYVERVNFQDTNQIWDSQRYYIDILQKSSLVDLLKTIHKEASFFSRTYTG